MDARVQRLARLLEDPALAESLVAAGLDTPKKIKGATDKKLKQVTGKAVRFNRG